MADDDPDDRELTRDALEENRLANDIQFVADGQELLDLLRGEGEYAAQPPAPRPDLILLDLNMPRVDGRQALTQIKADPELRTIPVVVLTTSHADADVVRSYDLGANSYITKPVTFGGLVEAMRVVGEYWFQLVALPER